MHTPFCMKLSVIAIVVLLTVFLGVSNAEVELLVPGFSDLWLSGMPDGTIASCWEPEGCDTAPAQSPQEVLGLDLHPGELLRFLATGGVGHCPGCYLYPPDGDESYPTNHNWDDDEGENGMSDVIAPYDCLLGVFLDDTQPDQTPDPPNLDFGDQSSRDYLVLLPVLKQVFFIGDGVTSDGTEQYVEIPAGTTRLFLGTMDSSTLWNNIGQFDVIVTECNASDAKPTSWGRVKLIYR